MDDLRRIIEVKEAGTETATIEDIPVALKFLSEFINTNPDTQKLITNDMLMNIHIEGAEPFHILIKDKKCQFGNAELKSPTFSISTDLLTIAKLMLGEIAPTKAFFSKKLSFDGSLNDMLIYLQVLDLIDEKFNIFRDSKREGGIKTEDLVKLYKLYKKGISGISIEQIPIFLNLLTDFAHFNPDAQELIEKENFSIQIIVQHIGDYLIKFTDSKMSWSEETIDNPTIKIEMDLKTAAGLLFADSSFLAFIEGKIKVDGESEKLSALTKAMVLQELFELLMKFLDLK